MRILIAEDHRLVVEGLRPTLQNIQENVTVVECSALNEALIAASQDDEPAVAILDLLMADMNGVEGIRVFHGRFPEIPVMVLSGRYGERDILKSFQYGAAGFIPKSATLESLAHAIKLVISGQKYVPPELLGRIQSLADAADDEADRADADNVLQMLTEREREVLDSLMEGQPNKAIARGLGSQEVTVKMHMRNIFRKLGAANRAHAVRLAVQSGWRPAA